MRKTTLQQIKDKSPCKDGWKLLLKNLNTTDLTTEVSLEQILDSNGVKDAYWALRCWDYKEYCLLLANVAESVLHVWLNKYPDDNRPQQAIEAIRLWESGEISMKELLAASSAAADAYAAADDAYAAAYAAADAAYYAAAAASSAAADAAYAAADAAYYAEAAYYADAWEKQWELNERLIQEFIMRLNKGAINVYNKSNI